MDIQWGGPVISLSSPFELIPSPVLKSKDFFGCTHQTIYSNERLRRLQPLNLGYGFSCAWLYHGFLWAEPLADCDLCGCATYSFLMYIYKSIKTYVGTVVMGDFLDDPCTQSLGIKYLKSLLDVGLYETGRRTNPGRWQPIPTMVPFIKAKALSGRSSSKPSGRWFAVACARKP